MLVTDSAEHIGDPETIHRLSEGRTPEPWAGGHRPLWTSIRPDRITGRRVGMM